MALSGSCPPQHVWQQLLTGPLAADQENSLITHLDNCTSCQTVLESLAGGSGLSDAAARHLSNQQQSDIAQLQPWIDRLKQSRMQLETDRHETVDAEPLNFLEPSDDPQYLGRLGRYGITEVVGRGGMGLVLKAVDPGLNRIVAIKVLASRLANDRSSRKRFLREARAVAAIDHDHVVTVFSVGKHGSTLYLEMQFVDGRSLQEKLDQQGALNFAEVLQIGLQTARGLSAAHSRGLIHRDVKPANILLERETQQVKISDFGLACVVEDLRLSSTEILVGTPEYIAPEQTEDGDVDHRADLFCFGSVLYAMCTGHSPFAGGTTIDVIKRVVHEEPRPIHEMSPAIPQAMVALIERLLAKDPAQRFQSAEEVCRLIEAQIEQLRMPSPPDVSAPPVQFPDTPRTDVRSRRLRRWGGRDWLSPFPVSGLIGLTTLVVGFLLLEITGVTNVFSFRRITLEKAGHPEVGSPAENGTTDAIKPLNSFLITSADDRSARSFEDLASAMESARDGDTIDIHGNGPFLCHPLQLVDKRLRIRAAAGFRPVLEMANDTVLGELPLLHTNRRLVLEGIELRRISKSPAGQLQPRNALVKVDRSELWIAHCRFVFNQPICGVRAEHSQLCRIRNSDFVSTRGISVGANISPQSQLFLLNNVMTGESALLSEYYRPNVQKARIVLLRNTVFSRDGIELVLHSLPADRDLAETSPTDLIQFEVADNVFRVQEALIRVEQSGELARTGGYLSPRIRDWLPAVMNWDARQNLFDIGRQYVRVTLQGRPARVALLTRDLADWQRLWTGNDLNSTSAQVEFAGADLFDSIENSPLQIIPPRFRVVEPQPSSEEAQPWGVDVSQTGPGAPYQSWKKTPAYFQWQQQTGFSAQTP